MAETAKLQGQSCSGGDKITAARQVQEMTVEFVNAINAAAAAEGECAKVRRLLEQEREIVQWLKEEKEEEARTAKRKIEKMSHLLVQARKDFESVTTRADFAEVLNELVKVKKELQEARELVQLLKPESEETRHGVLRQGDNKELESANALDAASIAESECDKLLIMLEEVRKLVQRLVLEKDDEAQLAKIKIEEIGQELANAQENAEYATTRADVAERECAALERMLIEEGKTVQRLILEKNDGAELAKRQIEKIGQELANARKDAQYAQKDADVAKNECLKLKGELKEREQFIITLKLKILEIRQLTMRQVEDITQELERAQREAEYARYDADIAKNEWMKAKQELQEKLELVKWLKMECQETRESVMRQVEQKELELANALDAATVASSNSAVDKDCPVCLINEKDTAFGCGHMTCEECGMMLTMCPICRVEITHRIKLFPG